MKVAKDALPVYESRPPPWLPKTHSSADLGYPGFYPPRPGQEEDLLTEANITKGFTLSLAIPAENFSAQDDISTRLANGTALTELEDLMNQVFARRAEQAPPIPLSSFRMPSRVTLNDAKRQAWFADLANPDVPLQKLGKSVPHGAKGHDLLDLLQTNNVAIPRAVWLLRVFGANEIAGLRNKPSYNPTQYSVEWANIVTGYMKKQLADIALPSAPRAGLNIKQTFKGVLADSDTRERWTSRFAYCLKLLRTFYAEGLVDNRTFLVWLVQQMGTCNLAQAAFVARIAYEYLDGMLTSRALVRPFAEACLMKLSEMRASSAQEYLPSLSVLLKVLLQRICVALPDALICPRSWASHSDLLSDALTEKLSQSVGQIPHEPIPDEFQQILLDNFQDIKKRNEAMLFINPPPHGAMRLSTAVSDIQLLNSITSTVDLDTFPYFGPPSTDVPAFADKLCTLLTWAVTPLQHGDHRPFAAVTLLRLWHGKAEERAIRHDLPPPNEHIQDQVFDWLDSSEVTTDPANVRAIAILLGLLVQHDLLCYASYIQRLIARGEPGLSFVDDPGSRHRDFLRSTPLHAPSLSLMNQRKVTLHGVRARETPEDVIEREIRREVRSLLPEIFEAAAETTVDTATMMLRNRSLKLYTALRFEQVRTVSQWLLPILRKHISSGHLESNALLRLYGVSVELMTLAKCYDCILELSLCMLEHFLPLDPLTAVVETIHRHLTVWACMQSSRKIAVALYTAHQTWRTEGIQSRALLALLVEVDGGQLLDSASRAHIEADISAFTHALLPVTDNPDTVPPVLPEILLLAEDPNPEAPSLLANNLWYKYRTAPTWAWVVWDNAVASLRQVPVLTSEKTSREACALQYGTFLLHVDQHLPSGLDAQILDWFVGTGKNEVAALSSEAWDVLAFVLVFLAIHGAVTITTILQGLVYPAWQLAVAGQSGNPSATFLAAVHQITKRLLLQGDESATDPPVRDLLDDQRLRTRRLDVFREPHFSLLTASIPTLVLIENNLAISEDLRASSRSLRLALCHCPEFHEGVNRNLVAVHDAFEKSLQSEENAGGNGDCIIDALRWIWYDSHPDSGPDVAMGDWLDLSSLLSPWKLSATAIQLRFILRQLDRALAKDESSQVITTRVDELTTIIFRHSMSSEEACLMAEMMNGVGMLITAKIINNGLAYLGDILETEGDDETLTGCFRRAGDVLRLLAHLTEPSRKDPSMLPSIAVAGQDKLIRSLESKFSFLESVLSSPANQNRVHRRATQRSILLARLLQYDLGFPGIWTPCPKAVGANLCSLLFRLLLLHGAGETLDVLAYSVMIDTLFYLLDELPHESKNAVFDPFRLYPSISPSDLPPDLSPEYRDQIRTLLPYVAYNATVHNLVTAHWGPDGRLVRGPPVLNRPWEWIENLGDNPVLDSEKERDEKARSGMRYLVKNTASLSLETFGARITGEGIIQNLAGVADDPRVEANLRTFEDGLHSQSIFERNWRESRTELRDDSSASGGRSRGEDDDESAPAAAFGQTIKRERTSPAASAQSNISLRRSPGPGSIQDLTMSTGSDVVEVESATASTSNSHKPLKRKVESDDEVEIIEGPIPASARAAKKSKTKSTAKTRAKKR